MTDTNGRLGEVTRRKFMGAGTAALLAVGGAAHSQAQNKRVAAEKDSSASGPSHARTEGMFIHAGTDSAGYPIDLSFVDYGKGKPVVLVHGWPLCKESWEPQLATLPKHMRVIAYDRRGFGKSSNPGTAMARTPWPTISKLFSINWICKT